MEINDLPNEVITKILRFLENHDLEEAILTCKFWKTIIESSCRWSLSVNCGQTIHEDSPQYNFLATTDRKFRRIHLRGPLLVAGRSTLRVIDIVRRHGLYVVELNVLFLDLTVFVRMLNCLPNLKKLFVDKVALDAWIPEENELPVLPKLEAIEIYANEYRILNFLTKAKVKELKVINNERHHFISRRRRHCDALENFLTTQDRLTTLALRSVYNSQSMLGTTNLHVPMPFQLTRLSLIDVQLTENEYSELLEFIERQSKSLKELELGQHFHHTIYECVFAKMTNLETLSLMMDAIPRSTKMLRRLKKNLGVKNLIMKQTPDDTVETVRFFRDFFKCLPNVTCITMRGCPIAIMEAAAENFKQIKVLQVDNYLNGFGGIHFPNLDTLRINNLYDKVDWQEFSRAHPRLTEITLQHKVPKDSTEDYLFNEIEHMTRANAHLQTLRFGEWFKADTRYLEMVRKNCPHLETLEFHANCRAPLDEQYDQSWAGVLRLCREDFFLRYVQSPSWRKYVDEVKIPRRA